ncbi:MAG: flagellar basal body protein, partial [Oscillospiraceae bacterium]|nr:flagellar basal body protein [Oscillospiraceae bacterium]
MRPTFSGIEIGRTGLVVSQKGLDVTSHNITNVDTAGYTRQRIIQTSIEPYNAIRKFRPVDKGLVGQGT